MKDRNTVAIVVLCVGLVIGLAADSFGGYVLLNERRVADQIRVWKFTPDAAINEQIRRDDMSGEGKFLYLASHPVVESKRDFNQICSAVTTDTSILGCYLEPTKRIYLFHETDKRLDGTEEVMGAREMLRAAWDRMTPAQHAPLVVQLRQVLADNNDPDLALADRMAAIRRDDPEHYDAELYATIGTEVPDVGSTLETSYDRYFVKRSVITSLNKHSIAYLVALKHKVDALVTVMNNLNTTLDAQVASFNADVDAFDSDIDGFNARAERPGGFTSQGQFNVARAALVARQGALQTRMTQINSQIDVFNSDLARLKALDKTALSLVKGLNVELDPVPDTITA